jgi:hypothetical protein
MVIASVIFSSQIMSEILLSVELGAGELQSLKYNMGVLVMQHVEPHQ